MIRELRAQDREVFLTMLDEFYHSPAVVHPVPKEHFEKTFDEAISGNPFLAVCILEDAGEPAGYGQLSFTYSTEAGGLVVMLEELYIRPQFQNKGLGTEYFQFVTKKFAGKASRFRLEVEPDNVNAIRLYRRQGYEVLPYTQMVREFGIQ